MNYTLQGGRASPNYNSANAAYGGNGGGLTNCQIGAEVPTCSTQGQTAGGSPQSVGTYGIGYLYNFTNTAGIMMVASGASGGGGSSGGGVGGNGYPPYGGFSLGWPYSGGGGGNGIHYNAGLNRFITISPLYKGGSQPTAAYPPKFGGGGAGGMSDPADPWNVFAPGNGAPACITLAYNQYFTFSNP